MFSGYNYRACRTTKELVYVNEIPSWPKADVERLCNSDEVCDSMERGTICGNIWHSF